MDRIGRRTFVISAAAATVAVSGWLNSSAALADDRPFPYIIFDRQKLAESPDNGEGFKHLLSNLLHFGQHGRMTVLNFITHDCSACNVQTHVIAKALEDAQSILGAKVSMIDMIAYDEKGPVYPNVIGHIFRRDTGLTELHLPYGQIHRDGRFTGKHFSITRGDKDLETNKRTIVRAIALEAKETAN